MQKYKKWKQVLSVSTAVCLCFAGAGSLMGCGSTGGEGHHPGHADPADRDSRTCNACCTDV